MEKDFFEAGRVRISIYAAPNVYAPHDDTQMLAEVALNECSGSVLEIGTGSGAISILLAKKGKCREIIACDINEKAVECARKNANENGVERITFIASDLFSSIEKGKKFDFILFNPPYLPTAKEEKLEGEINYAFDGGESGLEVAIKFLKSAGRYLKEGGKILMNASSLQDEKKLDEIMDENRMRKEIAMEKGFFFEKLHIYKIMRNR